MEKEDRYYELRVKQIAATAVVIPPHGETGEYQVKQTLYGLGEDGRVYLLAEHGWSAVSMHLTETHG